MVVADAPSNLQGVICVRKKADSWTARDVSAAEGNVRWYGSVGADIAARPLRARPDSGASVRAERCP